MSAKRLDKSPIGGDDGRMGDKTKNRGAHDIQWRDVAGLIPYAMNARTHSDEQVAQIAASIKEFGFNAPILLDGDNGIIAGHCRLMAARKLGMTDVPCIVLDHLTDAQRKAYILADNRIALSAGWDWAMVKEEIAALRDEDFDISLTGFTDDELADFEPQIVPNSDEDAVPEPLRNSVSVLGDIWTLGRHRLMCGDCTDHGSVSILMGGERAKLCMTDPPYGLGEGKESGKNKYEGYDDTHDNLVKLAEKWLPIAREVSDVVVFSPGVTNQWIYPQPTWVMCWFYGGGQLRSPWGFNCWQPFLCYGKEPGLASCNGARPDAVDMNTPSNASDIDHPCPKPVKLWDWFFQRLIFSKNAIVYEPFCGSGTTIISAEKTDISVRAMELTPYYVDIAIRRWQEFTGKKAVHESGRTFDEISTERGVS